MDTKSSELSFDSGIVVMSPLADPVVNAIFSDRESAGAAAASLIKAVLDEDGTSVQVGEILSVTPQRHYSNPGQRGCRVDVEIETQDNERVIVEVQLGQDESIIQRNLFAASRIYSAASQPGTKAHEMAGAMPKVIVIDILNYTIRDDNLDLIQPAKIVYTKPPQREAIPNFRVYSAQLPCIDKMKPEFEQPWYCWFYAMYHAHTEQKTLQEVLDMTSELKDFAARDTGFAQYCEQYQRVSTDPGTLDSYMRWIEDQMREQGMQAAAQRIGMEKGLKEGRELGIAQGIEQGIAQGIEQGIEKGIEQGIEKGIEKVALNLLIAGDTMEKVASVTGLSVLKLDEIKRQIMTTCE